jgi:hypothetical protein
MHACVCVCVCVCVVDILYESCICARVCVLVCLFEFTYVCVHIHKLNIHIIHVNKQVDLIRLSSFKDVRHMIHLEDKVSCVCTCLCVFLNVFMCIHANMSL